MNLRKTYASLLTADLDAAEGWYTKQLGREPDHRPMPTLLHWQLSDEGGLMLSSSKDIATPGRDLPLCCRSRRRVPPARRSGDRTGQRQ